MSLGNLLSETSATLDSERILIRQGEEGPDDLADYSDFSMLPEYSLFLATADEPGGSGDIISMPNAVTNPLNLGFGTADDIEESPEFLDSPFAPSRLKPEDLLAFHDGDLPDEGWGDCDFPKMPACCEHSIKGVTCIWYTYFGSICPDHPADIWPPRTEAEQEQYQAVCCDRIIDQVGIGCVPVRNRHEPSMEEEDSVGEAVEDFFPALTDFNAIEFSPLPDACKSTYRRDSQSPTECLPPEQ